MQNLLTQTWALLQRNWILLGILMLETLIQLVFKGGQLGPGINPFQTVALSFFHLAVLAGWLYQMKVILLRENHRTHWGDFFDGVARYFSAMMGGGVMFLFLLITGLLLSTMLAQLVAGTPNEQLVQKLAELWQAGKHQELEHLIAQNQEALKQIGTWATVVLAGMSLVGLYALTLAFWTHWVVLGNQRWTQAWRSSQQVMFRHWKPLFLLGLIWTAPNLLLLGLLLSGDTLLQFVALMGSLFAKTYFTLMFMYFLLLIEPKQITPLLETEPPTPKPSQE